MSYASIRQQSAAGFSFGAKWFLFRLSIYAAVAVVSAGLFLVGASVYAFLHSPNRTPAPSPAIEIPAPVDTPPAAPPLRLPGGQELVQIPDLQLTAEDAQFILSIINPRPSVVGARKPSIGDHPFGHLIPLLPTAIVERVPRLRGYRYDVDGSGAVYIVDPTTYRINAIIAPN
jgi:hypothetical protein